MNIRVDSQNTIYDGMDLVFRSPVDCSQVTGLKVYYPENGSVTSKEFAFADAHGNDVGDIDHLFAENVVVKVILDVTNGMAFVQNADTNGYLENRLVEIESVAVTHLIVTVENETASHTAEEIYEHIRNGGVAYLFDGTYYIPVSADANSATATLMYDDMIADHYDIVGNLVVYTEMFFSNQGASGGGYNASAKIEDSVLVVKSVNPTVTIENNILCIK